METKSLHSGHWNFSEFIQIDILYNSLLQLLRWKIRFKIWVYGKFYYFQMVLCWTLLFWNAVMFVIIILKCCNANFFFFFSKQIQKDVLIASKSQERMFWFSEHIHHKCHKRNLLQEFHNFGIMSQLPRIVGSQGSTLNFYPKIANILKLIDFWNEPFGIYTPSHLSLLPITLYCAFNDDEVLLTSL